MTVIPAKAGIQLNMLCEAHNTKKLCVLRTHIRLDSGLRPLLSGENNSALAGGVARPGL
jgi:hypothetical protein